MPQAKFAGLTLLLGATLVSGHIGASEYCSKEQYQHDRALIENAISAGTLVKVPKGLRDSILVQEGMWFGMNYPQQIDFMQSFECAMGGVGGKKLLYMDVRSLGTGKLLATWILGALKPSEQLHDPPNPERSGVMEDENLIGLTGEARAVFLKSAIEGCNKRSATIKEVSSPRNRGAGMNALRPKLEAAAKRCSTNLTLITLEAGPRGPDFGLPSWCQPNLVAAGARPSAAIGDFSPILALIRGFQNFIDCGNAATDHLYIG